MPLILYKMSKIAAFKTKFLCQCFTFEFLRYRCLMNNEHKLYPYIHQYVNNLGKFDQTRSITFPDVSPTQIPPKGVMNMIAGDFLEVYQDDNEWDCVASCFFIDCANNIVSFIENIYR